MNLCDWEKAAGKAQGTCLQQLKFSEGRVLLHWGFSKGVVLGCLPSCTGLELTEGEEGKRVVISGAQEVRTVLGHSLQ